MASHSREDVIQAIIEELQAELGDVSLTETSEFSAQNVDSLSILTVATALEEQFGVEVEDSQITTARTVGELADAFCPAQDA